MKERDVASVLQVILSSFKTLLPAHSKPACWLKDTDISILKAHCEG